MHLPYGYTTAQTIQYLIIFLGVMIGSIYLLRERHSTAIYTVWYVYSLFFVLFFGVHYIAADQHVSLVKICGSYEVTCASIYNALTNVDDELSLIAITIALLVVPQVLTYVLSGLSGSASAPRFVLIIERVAAWSFIKFSAGVAGILTAEQSATWLAGTHSPAASDFIPPLVYISSAFGYTWLQFLLIEERPVDPQRKWLKLRMINEYFTRHARPE